VNIEKWMKRELVCVKPLDSIQHARDLMEARRLNQLPVVVNGKLVGIVTDRNLRDAFPSVFDLSPLGSRRRQSTTAADPDAITVEMVMTPHVLTLSPTDSIVEAVRVMRQERIGAIPVVEGGRAVGIITRSDVLDAFVALLGGGQQPAPAPESGRKKKGRRA